MAICKPVEIKGKLAKGMVLLGLDVGTKTIGLAIADAGHLIASPTMTIDRTKFSRDWVDLEKIIVARQVGGLVVGLPLEMSGAEGARAQSVRSFVDEVLKRRDIPVTFWDERLSTAAVERMLTDEADLSRKRRAELVDKAAAAYILQGFLDANRAVLI
ncbi:MAG: Holliday junction resolvase RuvX [Alphaproteobacteria bacterium]|nr:Holliday junction resolvase RuvX [Alphaproteobacteria bacterium]